MARFVHDREIEQVVVTKQPIRGEVPFTGVQGRREFDYIFVPVLGANGEVEAVAGTTRDITDQKAASEALRESDRKKDDFIALLAHELRNPLAPIRNGLQVIRRSSEPSIRDQAQDLMDRQLAHMVRLIDDLLDVSLVRGRTSGELQILVVVPQEPTWKTSELDLARRFQLMPRCHARVQFSLRKTRTAVHPDTIIL